MTLKARITLLVLLATLSEAILLGVIAYNGVSSVSRNSFELRRIVSVIEETRALNALLSHLSDPVEHVLNGGRDARERFLGSMDDLQRKVAGCAAATCHGYDKQPPRMAGEMLRSLQSIRADGTRILSAYQPGDPPPLAEWAEGVDRPARLISRATEQMAGTLMNRAREVDAASRETDQASILLVTFATLFCIALSVALARPLARGMTRPLAGLVEQTHRIAEGNFEIRAKESGPPEIATLARSFNAMLDALGHYRDELLAHRKELELTVEERVTELRRKDEDLKRAGRLASVGLAAGEVAHDLNNPLTNILVNSDVLLESADTPGRSRGLVEDLRRDAVRCREIAAGIRTLSREPGIEMTSCAIKDLIEEAIRMLRFKWGPRRIAVKYDSNNGPAACLCSRPGMLQLLVNLIENAIDASPDDGLVEIRLRASEAAIVLEVQDYGAGIPPEARRSLFRPFFTSKAGGTGLGLAISRRIAVQHEGSIEFETRTAAEDPERHGTLFRVTIPCGRAAEVS